MTIANAKKELKEARAEQRKLRKRIDALRNILLSEGVDPDLPEIDLTKRDKAVYKMWREGSTFTQIANKIELTPTRISAICSRIDMILRKRLPSLKGIKTYLLNNSFLSPAKKVRYFNGYSSGI